MFFFAKDYHVCIEQRRTSGYALHDRELVSKPAISLKEKMGGLVPPHRKTTLNEIGHQLALSVYSSKFQLPQAKIGPPLPQDACYDKKKLLAVFA